MSSILLERFGSRLAGMKLLAVRYDTATGAGHSTLVAGRKTIGWSVKVNGDWLALWCKTPQDFVIQRGTHCWLLSAVDSMKVGPASQGRRRFSLTKDEETMTVEYESVADRTRNRIDPSYDGLDEGQDDFFVWAKRVWENPSLKESLLSRLSQP